MRLLTLAAVTLAAAAYASTAAAHPLPKSSPWPGLHKACQAVGVCHEWAPRPIPDCTPANEGQEFEIEDPKLGAIVTWVCRCPPMQECNWFRVRIRPKDVFNWQPEKRRWVWDKQRACPSIVCKFRRFRHYYPTLYAQGGLVS